MVDTQPYKTGPPEHEALLVSVMDALRSSIAVLDPQGVIVCVNSMWREFAAAKAGSCLLRGDEGLDYFAVCRAALSAEPFAAEALAGLEAVRDGRLPMFSRDYPCHNADIQRWFTMYARPLAQSGQGMLISHFEITEQKLAALVIQRDREQQEALRRILETVLAGDGVEATLTRVLRMLLSVSWLSLLPKGGVFRMEDEGGDADGKLHLIVSHNLAPEVLQACALVPLGHCHCGRAAASDTLQYAAHLDSSHEVLFPDMSDHGHYCVPISSGQRKLGVLMLYLPAGTPRDAYAEKFLTSVAGILATYLLRTEAEQALVAHQERLEDEVKARTQELRTSEARARALLSTMLEGVVHMAADGIVLSINHTIHDLFGYEAEELVGHNISLLMPASVASAHGDYLQCYQQTRQPHIVGSRREMEARRKDDRPRSALWRQAYCRRPAYLHRHC